MAELITTYAKNINTEPGNIEKRVLEVMSKDKLEYYDSLISENGDFQVWRNLSGLRTGLVSWYPFKESASVLEIGAGFGALTGMLCDRVETVVATEKSYVRAEALCKRFDNKTNLKVYVGDLSDIQFEQKFDYVILTGLLERIGSGSGKLELYSDYIKKVSEYLKEDGLFLISVENRFGLKYFCGAKEPHTNHAFDGIRGYRRGTKGRCFSRDEINSVVHNAGLDYSRFYYPLPDYIFPQLIYSDEYLPDKNLKERLIPYYLQNNSLIANEKELYDDVVANKVFPFLANSFLVECGKKKPQGNRALYSAISTDRGYRHSFATTVMDSTKGRYVSKRPLFAEGRDNAHKLYENIKDLENHGITTVPHRMEGDTVVVDYIDLPTLSNYLKDLIRKDTVKFESIIDRLYDNILKASEITGEDETLGPILRKAYMELIPLNAFYDEKKDEIIYFDQEFVRENCPAKYVLFRAIHYIYCFTPNADSYYPKEKLVERYGMQDSWEHFHEEEQEFLNRIRNHRMYAQFYRWADVNEKNIDNNINKLRSEEEKIADYVVSDKMKKIWRTELAILDEVDRICKKYNLTYYFVHGSLLGAVRHNGFIPWDDDLDIAMKRKDYDKFLELAAKELEEKYVLQTPGSEPKMYWGGFSRIRDKNTTAIEQRDVCREGVQGIWIDILPLDVYSSDEKKLEKQNKLLHRIGDKLYKSIYADKKINYRKLQEKLYNAQTMNNGGTAENLAFFTWGGKHRPLPAKDFAEVEMHDFEGRKVPLPIGYKDILFISLGKDYMKYPPVSERKPKHNGIFDPFVPYTEYQKLLLDTFKGAEGKKIILFGSGMMFEDYMEKYGSKYRPDFIVDNDENKWDRKRMGIDIRRPEAILDIPKEKRHLIICSYYYREISEQLDKMGITDYKVYVQKIEWILKTEAERK